MDEELERLVSSIRASTASPLSDPQPARLDPDDDSIPMLTDIVARGDIGFPLTAPRPPGSPGRRDLEHRIVEQILDRLRREPERMEAAVNDAVSGVTERFAVMIAIELGRDLEETIRKVLEPVVRQAVHEALGGSPDEPTL
jgi:hypothetical protein